MSSRIGRPFFTLIRPAAALLVAAAVVTGCVASGGAASPSAPNGSGAPSAAPSGSSSAKGFYLRAYQTQALAPQDTFGNLPSVTISDGKFIDGMIAIPMIYPGAIYVGLSERPITAAGIEAIVAEARKDGLLGSNGDFSEGSMPGSISAHIDVVVDGVSHDLTGTLPSDSTMTSATPGTVAAFHAFWNRISSLSTWLAADLGGSSSYWPASIAVMLTPPATAPADFKVQETAWPLGTFATFGTAMGTGGYRCATVTGSDLTKLLPVLQGANQLTRFTDSTGAKMSAQVLVLVPGDQGPCA